MSQSGKFNAINRLMSEMNFDADCGIIISDVNRRYFTGMKSSAGTLLIFKDKAYLIIDFRYIEKARKLLEYSPVNVILQKELYVQINELIIEHQAQTVAVEYDRCTISQLVEFQEGLGAQVVLSSEFCDTINELRSVKSDEQVESMILAQRIAEKGFEHLLDFIKVGKTEREIALELDYFMLRNGAEALSFDTIVLSGKNTSLPHGVPCGKKVEAGDFILMDYGAVVNGYHSDMTRTICVGEPTDEMKTVYDIVLKAQLATLDFVKAGISGKELDGVARDIINEAGYGENFGHSLGHGVGMEIHEAPTASSRSSQIFSQGMIITVEPGIYLADKFGVRIEDFVVVEEDGCNNMTKCEKSLIIL